MTGFGRGECVSGGVRYSVEISTVNRRNAELVFNLPRDLAHAEVPLREIIAPAVARGRATVTAAVCAGDGGRPLLDGGMFRRLNDELRRIRRDLALADEPTLSDLIRLYSVTAREGDGKGPADMGPLARAARLALRGLDEMRAREGAHLAAELRRLLDRFARKAAAVRKLAPRAAAEHRAALLKRLGGLDPAFATADERLVREIALFADRADITEELSRLESHVGQFRAGLDKTGSGGRTLDFLAQEMFREINTIGAKANSAAIAQHVVAAKTELERIREQVQNLE